jgi:hypothetical protein
MANKERRELPVVNADGVGRRELLQGLFAGVGASVALPAAAVPEAAHAHVSPSAIAEAQARSQAPEWKAEFLDAHSLATLGVLCARILPGSEKAHADRFIDAVLAVASPERQGRFLRALSGLEAEAMQRHQKPFKSLAEAQQLELLTAASTLEPSRKDWIWKPGEVLQEPERKPEPLNLRDHFDHVKTWIVDSYYSSQAGLKELGSTGQMFFETFPDCTHDEHR